MNNEDHVPLWKAIDKNKNEISIIKTDLATQNGKLLMLQQAYKDTTDRLMQIIMEIKVSIDELKKDNAKLEGSITASKFIVTLIISIAGLAGAFISKFL